MNRTFTNLNDFFNHMEFCPLCGSRMHMIATITSGTHEFIKNQLVITTDDNIVVRINLLYNTISSSYNLLDKKNNTIVVGRQCNKYHFFYSGIAKVFKKKLVIKEITLSKYHFIRMHKGIHYTVNGSFIDNITNIRITLNDFTSKEISLKLINFDFSSKKLLDKKLKYIALLG